MSGIIGKKVGMTSIYDESGKNIPCTILQAGPCTITQVKTEDKDGYSSFQLGFDLKTTNNKMELKAVIEGLSALNKSCQVKITTDSKYVLSGATEWMVNWKRRNWKTAGKKQVLNKDLWVKLDDLIQKHDVDWVWVKGHSGHVENEIADELANQGIDELT